MLKVDHLWYFNINEVDRSGQNNVYEDHYSLRPMKHVASMYTNK